MTNELTRLSVNLNQETADALKEYAAARNISVTEAVRRCVALTNLVASEQASGRRIIIEGFDGSKKRQVVDI